jgi:hypothetical protein
MGWPTQRLRSLRVPRRLPAPRMTTQIRSPDCGALLYHKGEVPNLEEVVWNVTRKRESSSWTGAQAANAANRRPLGRNEWRLSGARLSANACRPPHAGFGSTASLPALDRLIGDAPFAAVNWIADGRRYGDPARSRPPPTAAAYGAALTGFLFDELCA